MTIPHRPFYFLRHGQTDWNRRGVAQGATDIPLNATGQAQAQDAAEALESEAFTRIVASPLSRAMATAAAVAARTGLRIAQEPDLSEVTFGALEGTSHDALFDAYWAGTHLPEGAETPAAFEARLIAGTARALDGQGIPLLVSHGAVWRRLSRHLAIQPQFWMTNCAAVRVDPGPEGWTWRNAGVAELVPATGR